MRSCPIDKEGQDARGDKPAIDLYDERTKSLIDAIFKEYGDYTASQLSWITHQENTAWSLGNVGSVISYADLYKGVV